MKLKYFTEVSLFFNITPQYTKAFALYWHIFYTNCSGRSNCLPYKEQFSCVPKCLAVQLSRQWKTLAQSE
jgi:hypothetical protein